VLNEAAQRDLSRLIQTDRLANYAKLSELTIALQHISQRIMERIPKQVVRLQESIQDLQANEEALLGDFVEFFPQLIQFAGKSAK
jgi:acyl carrier protein phosphodiesterase